jgi:hypothetical protein
MTTIQELIKKLADNGDQIYSKVCKVLSVDLNERTCEVETLSEGTIIPDCRLQAAIELNSGLFQVPRVDSFVVVTWLNKNAAFVSLCSEVDQIQLNGDQYGGLVIYDKLKEQIDKNTDFLTKVKQLFDSWSPVAQDGGAALKASWSTITASLQTADLSDITNDTVKHG